MMASNIVGKVFKFPQLQCQAVAKCSETQIACLLFERRDAAAMRLDRALIAWCEELTVLLESQLRKAFQGKR
jgi:hypothetical protein